MFASRQCHALSSSAGLLFGAGTYAPSAAWSLFAANTRSACSHSASSSSAGCVNDLHQRLPTSIVDRAACHDMHVSSAGMLSRSSAICPSSMYGGAASALAGILFRQPLPHLQQLQLQQPHLGTTLRLSAVTGTGVWQSVRHASSSRGSRAPSPPRCVPQGGAAAAAMASAPLQRPAGLVQSLHSSTPAADEVAQHQYQSYDAATDVAPLLAHLHQQQTLGMVEMRGSKQHGGEWHGSAVGRCQDKATGTSYTCSEQLQQPAAAATHALPAVGGVERLLSVLQQQQGVEGSHQLSASPNALQAVARAATGNAVPSTSSSWLFRSSSHLKALPGSASKRPNAATAAAAAAASSNSMPVAAAASSSSSNNQQKLQELLQRLGAQHHAGKQGAQFPTRQSSSSVGRPPQVSSGRSFLEAMQQRAPTAGTSWRQQLGQAAAAAAAAARARSQAAEQKPEAPLPVPWDMLSDLESALTQQEGAGAAATDAQAAGSSRLCDVLGALAGRGAGEAAPAATSAPAAAAASAQAPAAAAIVPIVAGPIPSFVTALEQEQQQQQQQQQQQAPASASAAGADPDQQQQLLTQLLQGLSAGKAPSSSSWSQLEWQPEYMDLAATTSEVQQQQLLQRTEQQQQQQQQGTVTLQHLLSQLGADKGAASSAAGEQLTVPRDLKPGRMEVEQLAGQASPSLMLDDLAAALEQHQLQQEQQQQDARVGAAADAALPPSKMWLSDVVAGLGAQVGGAAGSSMRQPQQEAASSQAAPPAASEGQAAAMSGGPPSALPLTIMEQLQTWPQQASELDTTAPTDVAAAVAAEGQLADVMASLRQHGNMNQQQLQQEQNEAATTSTVAPAEQQQQQQQQEAVPTGDDQRRQLQQLLQGLSKGGAPSSSLLAQQRQQQQQWPRHASQQLQQAPGTLQAILAQQAARNTAGSSAVGVQLTELLQERGMNDTSHQVSNVLEQLSVQMAGITTPGRAAMTQEGLAGGSPGSSLAELLDRAKGSSPDTAAAAAAAATAEAGGQMAGAPLTSQLHQQPAQQQQALQQSLDVLQEQLQAVSTTAAAEVAQPAAGAAEGAEAGLQGLISSLAHRAQPVGHSSRSEATTSSSSSSAVEDLLAVLAGKAPKRPAPEVPPAPPAAAVEAGEQAPVQPRAPTVVQPEAAAGVQLAEQQQAGQKVADAVQPPALSLKQQEEEARAAAAAATEAQMQKLFKQLAIQAKADKAAALRAKREASGLTDTDLELSDMEFDQGSGKAAAAKKGKAKVKGSKAAAAGAAIAEAAAASAKKKAKGAAAAAAATSAADRWAAKLAALKQQTQEGSGGNAATASGSSGSDDPSLPAASVASEASSMREVAMPPECTVSQLAGLLDMSAEQLEELLSSLGEPVRSGEDLVSPDVAELAALEVGVVLLVPEPSLGAAAARVPRPPVVTVMGHVDHGKTSLLDALRNSNVAAGEAGGITQHIGAFSVQLPGSGATITFLDTPGHAAFGAMRARGAAVTDVVVLAVAADDGVMPQTREALAHARAANCPLVVALTKCDLPQADPDKVKRQLLSEGVELEEYGGDVQVVETAATAGLGLAELEEALLLQAEVMELAAAASGAAQGVVVEAQMERGRGAVATIIIKAGNLSIGDPLVVGTEYGKVRALRDSRGQPLTSVGPGQHAVVSGLKDLPAAGDEVQVVASEDRAARISRARSSRATEYRQAQLARSQRAAAGKQKEAHQQEQDRRKRLKERLLQLRREGKHKESRQLVKAHLAATAAGSSSAASTPGAAGQQAGGEAAVATADADAAAAAGVEALPDAHIVDYIIKADVQGSVEAVRDAIAALATERAVPRVVYSGAGPITTSDIHLAAATGAHLVAFNLKPPTADIEAALKQSSVEVMAHQVIYHLLDAVGQHMEAVAGGAGGAGGRETVVGSASVLQLFPLVKKGKEVGQVVGCRVLDGSLSLDSKNVYRLVREGEVVWEGSCSSLRRHKEDVMSVDKAQECGVVLGVGDSSVKVEPGDVLQCVARAAA